MPITVSDDDGLRRITIDRPEARNALTLGMAADIADAIETAEPADHYAILLEGVGESFSAGGDVVAMQNRGTDVRAEFERIADTFGRVVEAAMTADVPIVAKVQGDAIGAGLSLVAVSDLAYASTDARFSVAFVRVGLVPDTGGSVLLPHLIGLRETKRLALTGEFFDGTEAADLGLVTDAVPADQLDDIVDDMLDTLADQPTRIVGLIREAIHGGIGRDWRSALEHENQIQAQARDTVEHAESVQAFVERWGLK
ncbi:Enoyl-CoA hydratase/carnithine racemase [Halanaeroarchaeum sp. HSR-CO]|nr:enoyl-CoA hydratase-related protein [Halanaeroarchaeum sp. HSR-CO]UWG47653.1 Enoyl-CoA hydratase/carnithine racemase [Halanaeroarchaeum sp. HSR-CO]